MSFENRWIEEKVKNVIKFALITETRDGQKPNNYSVFLFVFKREMQIATKAAFITNKGQTPSVCLLFFRGKQRLHSIRLCLDKGTKPYFSIIQILLRLLAIVDRVEFCTYFFRLVSRYGLF